VENLAGFKFWATLTLLERGLTLPSFLAYVAVNTALVGGSAALTVLLAPAAAGSGIAEVKVWCRGVAGTARGCVGVSVRNSDGCDAGCDVFRCVMWSCSELMV
jgi:H+/Cl- antiporter ClcA